MLAGATTSPASDYSPDDGREELPASVSPDAVRREESRDDKEEWETCRSRPEHKGSCDGKPVIEVEADTPSGSSPLAPPPTRSAASDAFLSPERDDDSSRSPSSVSVRTQIPASVSPEPGDAGGLFSGGKRGCKKCQSATSSSVDVCRRSRDNDSHSSASCVTLERKVRSDTSLIATIRHWPSLVLKSVTPRRFLSSHGLRDSGPAPRAEASSCKAPGFQASLTEDSDEKKQPLLQSPSEDMSPADHQD